ncbi:MAG: hypothetical protein AAB316_20580 [Bacteroidota bacterium]
MRKLKAVYLKTLQNQYEYRANWLPDLPLTIGAVGKIDEGVFQPFTTLEKLDILVESASRNGEKLDFKSNNSISVEFKAEGSTNAAFKSITSGEAGFLVKFGKEQSIFLKTTSPTYRRIQNLETVEQRILDLYDQGKWKEDYVFISEVVEVGSGTVLISQEGSSEVEIKATANLGNGEADIADAGMGLKIMSSRGVGTEIVGSEGMTPLYKVRGIKGTGLLGRIHVGFRGGVKAVDETDGSSFDEVPFTEEEAEM